MTRARDGACAFCLCNVRLSGVRGGPSGRGPGPGPVLPEQLQCAVCSAGFGAQTSSGGGFGPFGGGGGLSTLQEFLETGAAIGENLKPFGVELPFGRSNQLGAQCSRM